MKRLLVLCTAALLLCTGAAQAKDWQKVRVAIEGFRGSRADARNEIVDQGHLRVGLVGVLHIQQSALDQRTDVTGKRRGGPRLQKVGRKHIRRPKLLLDLLGYEEFIEAGAEWLSHVRTLPRLRRARRRERL